MVQTGEGSSVEDILERAGKALWKKGAGAISWGVEPENFKSITIKLHMSSYNKLLAQPGKNFFTSYN